VPRLSKRWRTTGRTSLCRHLVSEKDKDHARVNEVLEAHRGERLADFLVTTNHVVAETITPLSKRSHRDPLDSSHG
jgi:predicted nucleic acid-binding protein